MKCTKTSPRNNFFILSTSKGPSHPITRRERAHRGLPPPAATLAVRPVPSPPAHGAHAHIVRSAFGRRRFEIWSRISLMRLCCFYQDCESYGGALFRRVADTCEQGPEHPGANSRILTVWEDGQELKGIHWLAFLVFLYVSKLLQLTFKCFKLEDTMRRGKKPSQIWRWYSQHITKND